MAQKKSLFSFFTKYQNAFINIGAAIVIVGLIFKINHYSGAEIGIAIGLGTEAVLFFILGLISLGNAGEEEETHTVSGGGNFGIPGVDIDQEAINKIETGLKNFADKIGAISNASDAALATTDFTTKIKTASASFDQLSGAFEKASANLVEMSNTNIDSRAYHDQVNNLAKNLSALNAVYELELQDSSAHLKAMSKFYHDMAITMGNFNESMEDAQRFKEEVAKLSKNLASLNAVYGNMLTAMNQPRS